MSKIWKAGGRNGRLTRVAEREAISGGAKSKKTRVWLDGADETFKELPDVLLDLEFLGGGKELDDKVEETLGEVSDETLLGGVPAVLWGEGWVVVSWREGHWRWVQHLSGEDGLFKR